MDYTKGWLWAFIGLFGLVICVLCAWPTTRPLRAASATDLSIYADELATGWQDWSWDTTHTSDNAAPVHSGAHSYAITYNAAWGGFYLHADPPLTTAGYTHLRFFIHGGAGGGQQITLSANQVITHTYTVTATAAIWTQIDVPLTKLNNPATIRDLTWQDATGGPQATYYLDDIALINATDSGNGFPDPTADGVRAFAPGPSGVAVAPSGRVYVTVYQADRVYSWPDLSNLLGGVTPDQTFGIANGDPDSGCIHAPSATVLCGPESVAVDQAGHLYVADTYNQRVLIFTKPEQDPARTTADIVLGQKDFTSQKTNYDANPADQIVEGMDYPRGLALDSQSNLYVVDEFNHRVLKFNQPLTTDQLPDLVIGQDRLDVTVDNENSGQTGDNRFDLPLGVTVDGTGRVYVTDFHNNRVLGFDPPFNHGPTAQVKLTGFDHPHDVAVDSRNHLFVADTYHNRVAVFAQPVTSAAQLVAEFPGLSLPMGITFTPTGDLVVADCGPNSQAAPTAYPPCLADPRDVRVFYAPPAATVTPTATPSFAPTAIPTLPPADVSLAVNVAADRHTISDLIYGLHAVADEAFAKAIALPIRRWGGNNTTRYNWLIGATNQASDWYFHNTQSYDPVTLVTQDADQWLQRNQRTGTRSLLTIPMIGYVAKDGDPQTCAFPVSKYPGQDQVDDKAGFPHCGNGRKNGIALQADPLDTSIAIDPTFIQQWVQHLQQNAATNGPVEFYGLDNEPDIWFETHRDVFPIGWKYDEFRDRTYAYAAAIKAVAPNAKLLGPVVNGWTYYWHGSWDGQRQDWETPDDRNAHGGTPFVAWYLQQMKAYEDQHGVRLLDYLDLHYYPQNRDNEAAINLAPAGDAATQAHRLRSTRALWDPTYVDESWVADAGPAGGVIQLLLRMKAWVAQNYPGTKLAITEYNWGGLESINGALAQADVLGIFGREGLDLATLFDPSQGDPLQTTFPSSPGAFAFRLYRNYDGLGGKFGDMSVQASSSDQAQLSIYAAERTADNQVTIVIINKTSGDLTAKLTLAGFTPAASAQVFRYAPSDLAQIVRLGDQALQPAGFSANFPANSLTLLVIPQQTPPATFTTKLFIPWIQK